MPTTLRAKCLIVGDPTVGKSAITQVYHSDGAHFPKTYSMTTGVELVTKTVNVGAHANSDSVELFLCDCAGKPIFQELVCQFWEQPNMIMLVFDTSNEGSFHHIATWLESIEHVRGNKCDVPTVLVGNKIDLTNRRAIETKDAAAFAQSKGMEYFECSAKEITGVEEPFNWLVKTFHQMYMDRQDAVKTFV